MTRRIRFGRTSLFRHDAPTLREGQIYRQDFGFVVLDEDASRWQRAKVWLLMRFGLFRPRS